ncbi:hypothetical protein K4H00_21570, partial [Mycobacterium tuberculosis]|nr:hypothetical protein [Mycobacterium tuberculosis]
MIAGQQPTASIWDRERLWVTAGAVALIFLAAIEALARETADGGPAVLIGTPWVEDGRLYNACALLD